MKKQDIEKIRVEISKRYKDKIQNLEHENKQLREICASQEQEIRSLKAKLKNDNKPKLGVLAQMCELQDIMDYYNFH